MLRNAAQRLGSSLLAQVEACGVASSSSAGSGCWEALRAISSTACAQRKLFPAGDPVRPDDVVSDIQRPYLVDKLLGAELLASSATKQLQRQEVLREYQRFLGDTGSSEVQVAVLTQKIHDMAQHMRQHKKDYSSRKGLEAMLNQRRKLLQYLRRSKFDSYAVLISRLGLKDSYGSQDRFSVRYKAAAATTAAPGSGGSKAGGSKKGGGSKKAGAAKRSRA